MSGAVSGPVPRSRRWQLAVFVVTVPGNLALAAASLAGVGAGLVAALARNPQPGLLVDWAISGGVAWLGVACSLLLVWRSGLVWAVGALAPVWIVVRLLTGGG